MMNISQEAMHKTLDTEETPVREGYKQTKLGWIPKDWSTPKIEDVFQFLKTNSYSRKQLNYDRGDVFYIHYGDIHATYKKTILDFEKEVLVPRINKEVKLPNNVDFLKDGDVVIADASEDYDGIGEAIEMMNLNGRKVISGLHTFALRDIDRKTVKGFRAYIFKSYKVKKALKTIATGSKVYGISKSNVQKFKIILPPLPEQQKIAQILSTWDKAIALQEQLITEKQALKKGLMQELLTGKKRFAGFDGEWEIKMLKEIGGIYTGGTPNTSVEKYWNGNIRWFTPTEVTKSGKYIDDSKRKITEIGLKQSSAQLFPENTIVVCTRATIGELSISRNKGATNQGFKNISPDSNHNLDFIYYKLLVLKKKFISKSSGSTFLELSTTDFKNFKIRVPSLEEQQKITGVLSNFDTEIENLIKYKDFLIQQKQGLMEQLLTGKKRVTEKNRSYVS